MRGTKPRKITEELLEKVEHLASQRSEPEQVCDSLGFIETWWHAKKPENSELGACYKREAHSALRLKAGTRP